VNDYSPIIDRLTGLGLIEEAFSVGLLVLEADRARMEATKAQLALDEIVQNEREQAALAEAEIVRIPPRGKPRLFLVRP
jgi:hypothetical protein